MRPGTPDDTTPEQSPTALPGRSRVCGPEMPQPVAGLAFPPHVRVRRNMTLSGMPDIRGNLLPADVF